VNKLWGEEASRIILKRKKESMQKEINKISGLIKWIEKELVHLNNTIDDYEYRDLDNDLCNKHDIIHCLLILLKEDLEKMLGSIVWGPSVLRGLFHSQWQDLWSQVKTQQKKHYRERIRSFGLTGYPIRHYPEYIPSEFNTPELRAHLNDINRRELRKMNNGLYDDIFA
jgi:hypothetical protein